MKLIESKDYSNIVCEMCIRSLHLAHAVKEEFCDNQKRLQAEIECSSQEPKTAIKESMTTFEIIEHEQTELTTLIKVEKDEVLISEEEQICTSENYEIIECDNTEQPSPRPSVSWNFTTHVSKPGMQLSKEEKVRRRLIHDTLHILMRIFHSVSWKMYRKRPATCNHQSFFTSFR
jgi:hypothetical protein